MRMGRIAADPATLLTRALIASAAASGCDAAVVALHTRAWASATFVGARHVVTLASHACVGRYRWLAELAEIDLPVRGHVVLPPAILSAGDERVVLEIIALEDH